ncbi:MoaD/ThiS family protein [Dactylosporangium sp. NPDC049140]|uniref:MoaD/ThiS family protein n=1 Tax=Dactylosporangium sp. NPDC049140 TaxID=3155647 RepID=UPI0033FB24BF
MIRVVLPPHLRGLAKAAHELELDVPGAPTLAGVLDALEERYPVLRGTIRDRATGTRRAFVRFYACEEDLSNEPPDSALPEPVAAGREPLLIIGAMAGG